MQILKEGKNPLFKEMNSKFLRDLIDCKNLIKDKTSDYKELVDRFDSLRNFCYNLPIDHSPMTIVL